MELESPQKHPLWHLLKGFLRLSYARLRWELRQRGHNVSERRLSLMLRGLTQIPPEIEKALKKAKNKDVTIVELPSLNHLFQTADTGAVSEYYNIEDWFRTS